MISSCAAQRFTSLSKSPTHKVRYKVLIEGNIAVIYEQVINSYV